MMSYFLILITIQKVYVALIRMAHTSHHSVLNIFLKNFQQFPGNARKRRADNTPTLGQQRTMKDYYSARKKLNFGAMPAKPIDRSRDSPELIVHPDCLWNFLVIKMHLKLTMATAVCSDTIQSICEHDRSFISLLFFTDPAVHRSGRTRTRSFFLITFRVFKKDIFCFDINSCSRNDYASFLQSHIFVNRWLL